MVITLTPRPPMLLSREQRIPSAEMQISPSKIKAPAVVKKSVHFNEVVSIRSTTHHNDMTSQEIAGAWFSRREMSEIKRSMAIEIKAMSSGLPFPGGTTRGLEFRTREGSDRRKANKLNSIHAVLDEQDLQLMRGINEPEGLRRVYLQHSQSCLTESQLLAKADETEVRNLLKAKDAETTSIDSKECHSKNERALFSRLFIEKKALANDSS
ncbi:hypothetical protein MHU86_24701 [Fragilaria crotonensis]|nr:hypothetical protein MHU86_24701 [Fragilaria crotonensis]